LHVVIYERSLIRAAELGMQLVHYFIRRQCNSNKPVAYVCILQWFSTFLSLRHTNLEKKSLAAQLDLIKTKILLILELFYDILRFGNTLKKFYGTLVCRGKPVEDHCYIVTKLIKQVSQQEAIIRISKKLVLKITKVLFKNTILKKNLNDYNFLYKNCIRFKNNKLYFKNG
jgi:hypothetical protein